MLTPQDRSLLESVRKILSQPDPYPETASSGGQDAWIRREEAESALAGLIDTQLAGGRVDPVALQQARDMVALGGTRARGDKVATIFGILAQAT